MPAEILAVTEETLKRAAEIIRAQGLVVFPTETVYGLGASALSNEAVSKIYAAKGRPTHNPLIVHLASFAEISRVADISDERIGQQLSLLSPFWPGPLSVVLPSNGEVSPLVQAGSDTVAVRIPQHPLALELLKACVVPLAAPSANLSNYVSPTTAQHVAEGLGDKVDLILDGGPCQVGIESTVVSLMENQPVILRPGAITIEMLRTIFPLITVKEAADTSITLPSPGMLKKHYSPYTQVIWRDSLTDTTKTHKQGLLAFTKDSAQQSSTFYNRIEILSDSGNLEEISRNLFAALRKLDKAGLDRIVIDSCSTEGLGQAIMDRLMRAAK